jgi:predicted membrane protein
MSSPARSGPPFGAILLILLGFLFLADQFGWFDFSDVLGTWWPAILIVVGLALLVDRSGHVRFSGVLLLVLGLLFLLANFNMFGWEELWRLWPVLLILLGLSMLVRGRPPVAVSSQEDTVSLSAVFGSHDRTVKSAAFRGGELNVVFGGANLDLREAVPVPGGAELHASVVFGGVRLKLPLDWDVKLEGIPIFGSLSDGRRRAQAAPGVTPPVLRVKASLLFGGIEVSD